MSDTRRSYSTQEVAQRLGVSVQTVQRWVDAGRLKAWKTLGGHRRIDAESAEALFTQEAEALGAPRGGQPSVLIVDDNSDDREILVHLVQQALPQAVVLQADNGFGGLVAVGQHAPTLLITDIVMPHMNGFEMLHHLSTEATVRPQHIVAVSSHHADELAKLGRLPAGVRLLSKPVPRQEFVATVRQLLGAAALALNGR